MQDHSTNNLYLNSYKKTNPNDNGGVRYFILGINMGLTTDDFNEKFDRGGYWDAGIDK